ncbi:SCAN box domain-containing protein [Trichonephila inaurata madagascariensis]|uniref:SCAN box domain-containing protein n=1 Tax=Trichonephila inaurata madagascariensis TaxID=2747483 RepID=A0A8X6X4F3_9ARAC|nr:SCAN box domain-containing protein [Trichonephila inaurata madagascariensis]
MSDYSENLDFSPTRKAKISACEKLRDAVTGISALHKSILDESLASSPSHRNSFSEIYRMSTQAMAMKKEEMYHVPAEVREHFLDDWIKLKAPYELAEKLDEYESIKQSFRREIPKKNSYKFQGGVNYSSCRPKETPKNFKSEFQIKREPAHEKNHDKVFEKRRQLRCYECGSYSDLRPQCDKLKKTPVQRSFDELMARYTSLRKVNVESCAGLRKNKKAAVLRDSLDQDIYLLRNKTAALLEDYKTKDVQMDMINAVQTRAQMKLLEVENEVQGQSFEQFDE